MVDTRLALTGQPINMMMPHEAIQAGYQTQAMKQRNAMTDMAMQDAEAAKQGKARLNALYQQHGGDFDKMLASGQLDMDTAVGLMNTKNEQAKLQGEAAKQNAQADKARMEGAIEKLNYGSQLLQGATPDNWPDIRKEFYGMTGQDLGEQFDPNKVGALQQQGLAMKDKLANEWKAKGYELDVARFGETRRHNQVSEGISQQNANKYSGTEGGMKPTSKIQEAEYAADLVASRGSPEWKAEVAKQMKVSGGDGGISKDSFNFANTLRDEYNVQTKDFVEVQNQVEKLKKYVDSPSSAGDQAIIFAAMKANDPTSTVRESEFALAASAGGYGEQIKSAMTKVQNGEMLTDTQRKDFLATAKKGYDIQKQNYKSVTDQYTELAKKSSLDPEFVVSKKDKDVFGENKPIKIMSQQQLQSAANAKFGGDINAAAQAARQHGYTIE